MRCVIRVTLFLFTSLFPQMAFAAPEWVEKGQSLSYRVQWLGMTAGYGEIRLITPHNKALWKPVEALLDKQAKEDIGAFTVPENTTPYAIVARIWSAPGIEGLFRMRDRLTAIGYFDAEKGFVPLYYMQQQQENDFRADKHLAYRHDADEVQYRNRRHRNSKGRVYAMPGSPTYDMFSALMSMRYTAEKLTVGDSLSLPTCQLEHCGALQTNVVKRDTVKTALGRKRILQVDPRLIEPNPKKKTRGSLHIQVLDGESEYLPVEIRLRAFFGNFTASLESVQSGDADSKAPADLPLFGAIKEPTYKTPVHANPNTL